MVFGQVWDDLSSRQQVKKVVGSSQKFFGQKRLQVRGTVFRQDCSGYVQAVFHTLGFDLDAFYRAYRIQTNGVNLIKHFVERSGAFEEQGTIKLGDLVFFSNTYDQNKDGKLNDEYTHIGIVESISTDGTIAFLHYLQNQVRRDWMNLKRPSQHTDGGKIINSYLRRQSKYGSSAFASQLFVGFGRLQ